MKIIAITQKGLHKNENEDRIIVGKTILANGMHVSEFDEGILAVADGVGGNNAGTVASHFVANKISALSDVTIDTFQEINHELLSFSRENAKYQNMATTLSGVFLSDNNTQLFSVGNSRVYLLQSKRYLKQLTVDDTTVNYLRATGQLTAEEAETYERKNEITACFGGGSEGLFRIKLDIIDTNHAPIMITSDGVHDYLSVDQMEGVIEEYGLSEQACKEMIRAAQKNGSHDDISILLGGV